MICKYRSGQSIPNEEHQKHQRPDSSEIRRATTQSSSTVEYRLEQRSSSGGEDVSQASVSGEMQSTTMQNLLIGGPLSKRMKSDSGNYSLRLCHVKINLIVQFVISLTSPDHIKLVRKNYTENYTENVLLCCNFCNNLSNAI